MYGAEPFELSGDWWVPGGEDTPWKGTLKFESSEGGRLKVLASLGEAKEPELRLFQPLVFGRPLHNKEVTLARCHESASRWNPGQLCEREVTSYLMFHGFLLPSLVERKIKTATVSFQLLNRWVASSGMSIRDFKRQTDFDFRYREPRSQRLRVADDLTLELRYFPDHSTVHLAGSVNPVHPDGDFNVSERIYIGILPARPESWEYFERVIRILQDFFTIAMLRLSLPTSTKVEASFGPSRKAGRHRLHAQADVHSFTYYADPEGDSNASDFLFREGDVSHGLESALSMWFSRADAIRHARMLYVAGHYSQPTIESKYLMFCQALESYHRARGRDTYVSSARYEAEILPLLIAAIPDALHQDFRASLRGAMKYAHEFSFVKRLKLLAREHSSPLGVFIRKPQRLMRSLSLYRNYMVHHTEPEPGFVYRADRVFELSDLASFMLELCFLREMGFDSATVKGLVARNLKYRMHERWDVGAT